MVTKMFTVGYETAIALSLSNWFLTDCNAGYYTLIKYDPLTTKCFTFELYNNRCLRLYAKDYAPRNSIKFNSIHNVVEWMKTV